VGPLKQDTSDGSIVSKLLDKLMVVAFEHLESCQNDGRLDQVWHQMGPH
jgi:RNA polymerase I-specific transcription initiation factor RRN3